MAQPSAFPEANLDLWPPKRAGASYGDQFGEVIPLKVCRSGRVMVSRWELSPEEKAEVERTGVIWLAMVADQAQPPALVTGLKEDALGVGENSN